MPTSEPTDAQIDAHVEAEDLWEEGFNQRTGEYDWNHDPACNMITKGRAKGYRANDPRIRPFWREEEWDDEQCDECGFVMQNCDCEPGTVSRERYPFANFVSNALDELSMAKMNVRRASNACKTSKHGAMLDMALQMLEVAQNHLECLPVAPDEDEETDDD